MRLSDVMKGLNVRSNNGQGSKRVGILGSAFDPPHFGHFLLAQLALQTGELDDIWLVPSPERWDKSPVAGPQERLSWLKTALSECPKNLKNHLLVSDIELKLSNYRGTYWLLQHLRQMHPETSFSLILGWDSFQGIPQWRDPTTGTLNGFELLKTTRLYVTPRATHANTTHFEHPATHPGGVVMLPALDDPAAGDIHWLAGSSQREVAALSSSLVRAAFAGGESLCFLFPKAQRAIEESKIYTEIPRKNVNG